MKNGLYLIAVLVSLSACSKSELSTNECDKLQDAVIGMNSSVLEKEINKLCHDLSPQSTTANDLIGHEDNINTLISRLETNCDIEAELVCYACIKTLPAQSEIKVTVNLLSGTYFKIIDISTPEDNKLSYENIHN